MLWLLVDERGEQGIADAVKLLEGGLEAERLAIELGLDGEALLSFLEREVPARRRR